MRQLISIAKNRHFWGRVFCRFFTPINVILRVDFVANYIFNARDWQMQMWLIIFNAATILRSYCANFFKISFGLQVGLFIAINGPFSGHQAVLLCGLSNKAFAWKLAIFYHCKHRKMLKFLAFLLIKTSIKQFRGQMKYLRSFMDTIFI